MIKGQALTEVSGITSRLVSFPGPSGMQVVGYVDEGDEELWNERVVILAPRYGETKKNNLQLAYALVANGFKVLRIDQTNHIGESDGTMDQFTLLGVTADILASVEYVDTYYEPDEIILVTLSLSSRCGLRASSKDRRISRFVSLVGMVNLNQTLQAIYNRDIFGEFVDGASWKTIDILGFEIEAANFHGSLLASDMQDLEGALKDAKEIGAPVLHLYAERDLWVSLPEVKEVIACCRKGELLMIPDVGHEVNEKAESAQFAFTSIIQYCQTGLAKVASVIEKPCKITLLKQNKIERSRLQGMLHFSTAEDDFWGEYLGKFGIIEEAKYYVEYFSRMAELLGNLQSGDVMLDAGCGNGFYGVNIIRSLLMHHNSQGVIPLPVHYCGMDLTSHGLARSYSRHITELVELQRRDLNESSGIGFSYRKLDFDKVGETCKNPLPFADGSISKICSSLVLSYLKTPVDLMKEFYRVLKPGGVAVISSMKPGCDMTVLYHDSLAHNYSEDNDRDAKVLLGAAGQIKLKKDAGIYNFFSAEELERLAFDSSFIDIRSFRSFGDQANVIRIVK